MSSLRALIARDIRLGFDHRLDLSVSVRSPANPASPAALINVRWFRLKHRGLFERVVHRSMRSHDAGQRGPPPVFAERDTLSSWVTSCRAGCSPQFDSLT